MENQENTTKTGFAALGLSDDLLTILAKLNLNTPTPIQKEAIKPSLAGHDVVGVAQTGTGKTFAFGLPMIQRLRELRGRGLIVLPTRELAAQVSASLLRIGADLGLRTAVLIGGEPINRQIAALKKDPQIIIGTPGRLIDCLGSRIFKPLNIKMIVLDEADTMFDMGFAPQIEKILAQMPTDRQTLMFSATMPPEILKLASKHMKTPMNIEVAPAGTTADQVDQEIYVVNKDQKINELQKILLEYANGPVLIFVRTKYGAKNLAAKLRSGGQSAAEIHSNLSLAQRSKSLAGFKSGQYRILIGTDIAARGIDVKNIALVVNFDMPEAAEDYVHRIGRTGRAGKSGKAISLATPDQFKEIKGIEKLIKKSIPTNQLAPLIVPKPQVARFGKRRGGGGYRQSIPKGFGGGKTNGRNKYNRYK